MKRRDFIAHSGLLGGLGITLPGLLNQKPRKVKSVIILGAGFAGLERLSD